jgi:nitrogen fixation protein NifU and related proteins
MLNELYQDIIIDHTRSPRNFGILHAASHQAEGHNPLCGDELKIFLLIDQNNVIEQVRFTGAGCSISTASASLMTETLLGKTVAQAEALFKAFHAMLTQENFAHPEHLDKLAVFAGVQKYPARVKCATLAWHTLQAALQHAQKPASTE